MWSSCVLSAVVAVVACSRVTCLYHQWRSMSPRRSWKLAFVSGFWGRRPWTPLRDFRPPDLLFCPPRSKFLDTPLCIIIVELVLLTNTRHSSSSLMSSFHNVSFGTSHLSFKRRKVSERHSEIVTGKPVLIVRQRTCLPVISTMSSFQFQARAQPL